MIVQSMVSYGGTAARKANFMELPWPTPLHSSVWSFASRLLRLVSSFLILGQSQRALPKLLVFYTTRVGLLMREYEFGAFDAESSST